MLGTNHFVGRLRPIHQLDSQRKVLDIANAVSESELEDMPSAVSQRHEARLDTALRVPVFHEYTSQLASEMEYSTNKKGRITHHETVQLSLKPAPCTVNCKWPSFSERRAEKSWICTADTLFEGIARLDPDRASRASSEGRCIVICSIIDAYRVGFGRGC